MTPEERFERIERQIEFIVGHQATQTEQIRQLGDFLLRTARFVEDFARGTEERFSQVAEWQQRSDRKMEELAEAQRRTDERMNVLIGVVERYFSNGGRSRN